MSKKSTPIRSYMTPAPHSIGREQTLAHAHDVMRTQNIRHLPVLQGGRVVGIISIRDLHLIETLPDVDPEKVPVEDAMTEDVYSVSPETELCHVAAHMAEHKLGSAVVVEHGRVVGLFTTTDALRALVDALTQDI
jgi:acetoin utilization protein AcuB